MIRSNRQVVIVAHDIRSAHNIGALLRTAECMGVVHVYFSGYTPYPQQPDDTRLPHIVQKLSRQIHKTALGAEHLLPWSHAMDIHLLLRTLKADGYIVAALEQSPGSIPLPVWQPPLKVVLLLGREVEGVAPDVLAACDMSVEIPQFGQKESLNVVQATAMALYRLCLES